MAAGSLRQHIGRLWPSAAVVGVLPGLKAFSGLSVLGHKPYGGDSLERMGSLEVRFARNAAEVREAQRIRYDVFYREGAAAADIATRLMRRDVDAFDAICDHLLVIDHGDADNDAARMPKVVGTYRLLRQEIAQRHGGFYTALEFDIAGLIARYPNLRFLELGRSCVLAPYRNKRTLELLWHGIGAFTAQTRPDVMIGCASLEGTDPDKLALPLSYLYHYGHASDDWHARALPDRYVEMNRIPKDAIDPKAALRELPPLIKGYLRLGAFIGEGAVIDRQFGTTDVLIVLPVAAIKSRYITHFRVRENLEAA